MNELDLVLTGTTVATSRVLAGNMFSKHMIIYSHTSTFDSFFHYRAFRIYIHVLLVLILQCKGSGISWEMGPSSNILCGE